MKQKIEQIERTLKKHNFKYDVSIFEIIKTMRIDTSQIVIDYMIANDFIINNDDNTIDYNIAKCDIMSKRFDDVNESYERIEQTQIDIDLLFEFDIHNDDAIDYNVSYTSMLIEMIQTYHACIVNENKYY